MQTDQYKHPRKETLEEEMDRLMKRYGGRQIQWLNRDGWGHHLGPDDGKRPPNTIHLDALFKDECGEMGMDDQGNLIPAEVAAANFAAKMAARRLNETLNPGAENKCGVQVPGNLISAEEFAAKRARAKQILENLNPASASASASASAAGTKAAAGENEEGEDDEEEEVEEENDLTSKQGPALKRPRKDLVETDSSATVSSSSSPKN